MSSNKQANRPFWQGKNVLIAGGAGFIGSNLALELVRRKAVVTVVDKMCSSAGGNIFNLAPVKEQIHFKIGDIGDANVTKKLIAGQDFIFNLAGLLNHLESMHLPLNDLKENVEAQLKFLEICRAINPNVTIIYTSSRQIYGTPVYLPVDEKHPIRPVDINGIHKNTTEQYHSLFYDVYQLRVVSLRLTNTYGPRQLIRNSHQGVVGWFINRLICQKPIQLFDGGNFYRDFNYVDDVTEALLLAASTSSCHGSVFNLSGERATLEKLVRLLLKSGRTTLVEEIPFPEERRKIDMGNYYGTSKKFQKLTGWAPKTSLKEGLKKTVEYFIENQDEYLERLSGELRETAQ